MSDLTDRLRFLASGQDDAHSVAIDEAANEIDKLRLNLNEFRDALENIAGTTCGSDCNDIARQILKEFPD